MITIFEDSIWDGYNNKWILRDHIMEDILKYSPYSPLHGMMQSENHNPPKTHKVEQGETYWSIAQEYGVSVQQLRNWNGYEDTEIPVGAILIVSNPIDTAKIQNDALAAMAQVPSLQIPDPEPEPFHRGSSIDCHGHGMNFNYGSDDYAFGRCLHKVGQWINEHLMPGTGTFWTNGPSGGGWDHQNDWPHKKGANWDIETDGLFTLMGGFKKTPFGSDRVSDRMSKLTNAMNLFEQTKKEIEDYVNHGSVGLDLEKLS